MNKLLVAAAAFSAFASGCAIYETGPYDYPTETTTTVEIVDIVDPVPAPFVDTYLDLPAEVLALIAPAVQGFFSPEPYRYDALLKQGRNSLYSSDQPGFVEADFNGDGYSDFAMLFSREEYYRSSWDLTTVLLVVTSTRSGYALSVDMELGTVTGSLSTAPQEFWAIGLMREGTHTVSTWYNNKTVSESVTLQDDGFYLTTLDASEEYLYYATGTTVYEMAWPQWGLAKKSVQTVGRSSDRNRSITAENIKPRAVPFTVK